MKNLKYLGLKNTTVELIDYHKEWEKYFEVEKNLFNNNVKRNIKTVHIGSTAVKGLCAKPIIDIMIGIENESDRMKVINDLIDLGYINRGELGIPDRTFLKKTTVNGETTHHVHLVIYDSEFWFTHLLFRDILRRNKEIRIKYAEMKKKLQSLFHHKRKEYTEAKTDFITKVVKKGSEGYE